MKGMLKKTKHMDYLLLKQLIVQVNHDLKDILQVNIFSLDAFGEGEMFLNGKSLSKTEQRHTFASSFARSILDNPRADYPLTARQYAAANLLYYWGRILRPPEMQPNHMNLLNSSIKNYISCLETNEAKLFNSLVDNDEHVKGKHQIENLSKPFEYPSLLALADHLAEEIRTEDAFVSLNKVSNEMTKPKIRNQNPDLLNGQKGWHSQSWIKTKLKGWRDPIRRK